MPKKPLLIALTAVLVAVASSSALAGRTHKRHHRHSQHAVKVAALVSPTLVSGDPADCGAGTSAHPGLGITGASTLNYNSDQSGSATDGTLTVNVTTSDSKTFDFSAALPKNYVVFAVLAEGVDNSGDLYDYRGQPGGGVLSDSGLHPPTTDGTAARAKSGSRARTARRGGPRAVAAWFSQIKHILFCYGTQQQVGPTGPTGPTSPSAPTTPSGGTTTTAPSSTPPVTPVSTPSQGKKKVKHHAPRKARRKRSFTG